MTINAGSYTPNLASNGFPVTIQNQDAASTISFNDFDISGNDATPDLFNVLNSNGTITVTGGTFASTGQNDVVDITGGAATISIGATITHTGAANDSANAVEIDNVTGGSVTFTGPITETGAGSAVDMNNNSGGVFNFQGLVSSSGGDIGVDLTNNTGATINFTGGLDLDTTDATAFLATGGGTIGVVDPVGAVETSLTSTGSTALNLNGVTIAGGGATFSSVTSTNATTNGVSLVNLNGGTVSLGTVDVINPGATGIDMMGNSNTISFDGAVNVSSGTQTGVSIMNNPGATSFSGGLDIDTTSGTGLSIVNAGMVTVSASVADESITTQSGTALSVSSTGSANVNIALDSVDITGLGASDGISLTNATGSVTVDGGTITTAGSGRAVVLNGGTADLTLGADIVSASTGAALDVQNRTGGTITVNGNLTDTNTAAGGQLVFGSNTGGSTTFNGNVQIASGTNAALALVGNAAHTVTFAGTNTDIDTTSGIGATIISGATLNFNSTGTNTLDTTTGGGIDVSAGGVTTIGGTLNVTTGAGSAVNIQNTEIGAGGITLANITTTGGAGAGLAFDGVSGGAFNVTGTTSITNPGSAGVEFNGTNNASFTFTDLDIALQTNNAVGVSVNGATLNGTVSATDFDLTSTTATGTIGVDLTGVTGTGTLQLGDTDVNGQDASIAGVETGILFDDATAITFIFGDGEGDTDTFSSIAATTAIDFTDATGANGTINVLDVIFPTLGSTDNLQGPSFFFVDDAGTGTGSSQTDAGSILGAEASSADVIVLIDTTDNGSADTIDLADAQHSSGDNTTLDIADGQAVISLSDGQTVNLGDLGFSGGPSNILATGIDISLTVTGEATLDSTGPTLTTGTGNTIELAGSGGVQGVTVVNTGGGNGINSAFTGTDATVRVNGNTVTANTGTGINIDGSGASGTVTIASFNGNTVTAAGNRGINVNAATFDADPSTGAIEGVAGGNTTIGSVGTRVSGDGIRLNNVNGQLDFGTLNIFNDNGTGLFERRDTAFTLTSTDGTVNTTNGTAVDIGIGTIIDLNFAAVSSTNASGQGSSNAAGGGIFLNSVDALGGNSSNGLTVGTLDVTASNGAAFSLINSSGAYTFGDTNVDNVTTPTSGTAVNINAAGSGDNATVRFTGEFDIDIFDGGDPAGGAPGNPAVNVQAFSGGRVTFSIAQTDADQSILITDSAGGFVNLDAEFTSGAGGINIGADGIHFDSLSATGEATNAELTGEGAFRFIEVGGTGNVTVDSFNITDGANVVTGFEAVDTSVDFTFGSFTMSNAEASQVTPVVVSNSSGDFTFQTVDITPTAGGTPSGTIGQPFRFTNTSGAIAINGGTILANSTTAGIQLINQANSGSLTITNTNITTTDPNNGGDVLQVTGGGGTVTVNGGVFTTATNSDVVDIQTTSATVNIGADLVHTGAPAVNLFGNLVVPSAVEIDGTTGDITFTGNITNTNGGDLIKIGESSAPTSGTITFSGTTLSDTGGQGIQIDALGAGASVVFGAGTTVNIINPTTTGIDIQNAAGSVTFNGPVNVSSGALAAVNLANNIGGTVNFAGPLDIDTTTGAGFTATGGGTVTATGAGSTIDTTTGTAVTITNTTIGAAGVTLQSVNQSGGTNAIVLTNTGNLGGFSVTGNGVTGGVLDGSNNNSGGVITGTSGDAISLTNTGPVSITQMRIGAAGALGNIGGSGIRANGVNGLTVRNTDFINVADQNAPDEAAIFVTNPVAGSDITLTNNLFNRSFDDHVRIENSNMIGTVTVSQNQFDDNTVSGNGNDALLYIGSNGSNATINVTGNSFLNSDGDHIQIALNGNSNAAVNIGGPTLADGNTFDANTSVLGSGITLSSGGGFSGSLTYLIQNNTINNAASSAINVNLSGTSTVGSSYSGTISDNTIGTAGVANSGGFGIAVSGNGAGTITTLIDNNTIREFDGDGGINISADEGTNTLNATITNNVITNTTNTDGFSGLLIGVGAVGGDAVTVCANVQNNTLAGTAGAASGGSDIFFAELAGNNTLILPGFVGSDANDVAVFLSDNQADMPTAFGLLQPSFTLSGGAGCMTP